VVQLRSPEIVPDVLQNFALRSVFDLRYKRRSCSLHDRVLDAFANAVTLTLAVGVPSTSARTIRGETNAKGNGDVLNGSHITSFFRGTMVSKVEADVQCSKYMIMRNQPPIEFQPLMPRFAMNPAPQVIAGTV